MGRIEGTFGYAMGTHWECVGGRIENVLEAQREHLRRKKICQIEQANLFLWRTLALELSQFL